MKLLMSINLEPILSVILTSPSSIALFINRRSVGAIFIVEGVSIFNYGEAKRIWPKGIEYVCEYKRYGEVYHASMHKIQIMHTQVAMVMPRRE